MDCFGVIDFTYLSLSNMIFDDKHEFVIVRGLCMTPDFVTVYSIFCHYHAVGPVKVGPLMMTWLLICGYNGNDVDAVMWVQA